MTLTPPTSIDITEMLSRGYLPKELPRSFTSSHFAAFVARGTAESMPTSDTHPTTTNLIRPGLPRRRLSIPNPEGQLMVVQEISKNWDVIMRVWAKAPILSSHPVLAARRVRRYLTTRMSMSDRPKDRIRKRIGARYAIHGDISACYHSIYTHSFAWSAVGKLQAKIERYEKDAVLASLDRAVRKAQSGQSVGIPIGPDSSLVLAELVLSAVDTSLMDRLRKSTHTPRLSPVMPAIRLIDDFEYYAQTRVEAEDVLLHWQEALADFELTPNAEKTRIAELPEDVDEFAFRELRRFTIRSRTSVQTCRDIEDYFGLLWDRMSQHPKLPLASYAMGRLDNTRGIVRRLSGTSLEMYIDCCLATITWDPSAIQQFARLLFYPTILGHKIDWDRVCGTIHGLISVHARQEHGVVVSWCLEILRFFERRIDCSAATAVGRMYDNPSLILLSDLIGRKMCDGVGPSRDEIANRFAGQPWSRSSDWMIAYYLSLVGVLKPPTAKENPMFNSLFRGRVSFFDSSRSVSKLPRGSAELSHDFPPGEAYL